MDYEVLSSKIGLEYGKTIFIFEMKNLESSKSKFAKMKIPKLSIKKALLGYFLPGI